MDSELCEFLAGDALAKIKPRFSSDVISLLAGDVGPFEAGMPVTVPLWLAVDLRLRQKCEIVPPDFLAVDELKKLLAAEREAAGLAPLPEAFFETAHMLVRHASEDLVDGSEVKVLVADIRDKRQAKLNTSILAFLKAGHENFHARVDNVSRFELAVLRQPVLAVCKETANLVENLHIVTENAARAADSQPY